VAIVVPYFELISVVFIYSLTLETAEYL